MKAVLELVDVDLRSDRHACRAQKKPVVVMVEFADSAGVLGTLEGQVRFESEDALLTAASGERWPVARKRFDESYQPVSPTVFGSAGAYLKRPLCVWARCMEDSFSVCVGRGSDRLQGRRGDWLLQYGVGEYGVVAADIFAHTYELMDDPRDGRK